MTSDVPPGGPPGQDPQDRGAGDADAGCGSLSPAGVVTARPAEAALSRVPIARPAVPEPGELVPPLARASRQPWKLPAISAPRALAELLLLIPAGILGGLGVPLLMTGWLVPDERWYNVGNSLGTGLVALCAALFMLRLTGHRPASIGWTRQGFAANVGIGLAGLALTYMFLLTGAVTLVILYPEILSEPTAAQEAIEATFPPMPLLWAIPIMVFVAVWEEFVFRGFVLTRLHALLKRWWLTVPIAAVTFSGIHYLQGLWAMVIIFTLAMVMGTLFVWRRSLVPSIVYHAVHNVAVIQLLRYGSPTWD